MNRQAFTLLEVMLAIGLIIMLFAGIFVFYDHSIESRAQAQRSAQEAQLAGAVLEQMARDLRGQTALPGIMRQVSARGGIRVRGMPSGRQAEPVANAGAGITGTGYSIAFQTSRCIPLSRFVPDRTGDEQGDAGQMDPDPASDLQQVRWWWSYDPQTNTSGGLYRSRRTAVSPPPQEGSAAPETELIPEAIADPEGDEMPEEPPAEPQEPQAPTNTVTVDTGQEAEQDPLVTSECISPEVQWVYFRYFDGTSWSDTFEPSDGAQTPQAVEITIGFEPLLTQEQFDANETVEKRLAELFGVDSDERLPPRSYRTVVFLRPADAQAEGGLIIRGP